jgi:hypothetical protein
LREKAMAFRLFCFRKLNVYVNREKNAKVGV